MGIEFCMLSFVSELPRLDRISIALTCTSQIAPASNTKPSRLKAPSSPSPYHILAQTVALESSECSALELHRPLSPQNTTAGFLLTAHAPSRMPPIRNSTGLPVPTTRRNHGCGAVERSGTSPLRKLLRSHSALAHSLEDTNPDQAYLMPIL